MRKQLLKGFHEVSGLSEAEEVEEVGGGAE
jgi:hypothetical protein